jgi:hypothetical protein
MSSSAGEPRAGKILVTLFCAILAVQMALRVPTAVNLLQPSWRLAFATTMPFAVTFASLAFGAVCFLLIAVIIGWTCSTLVGYVAASDAGKIATLRLQTRTLWVLTVASLLAALVWNVSLAFGAHRVDDGSLIVSAMNNVNAMPKSEVRKVRADIAGGQYGRTANDTAMMARVKAIYARLSWEGQTELRQFLDTSSVRSWDISTERQSNTLPPVPWSRTLSL